MNAVARDADAGPARTVLVVEDEPLVRETIVCELEDAGFGVFEAETAETGLAILKQQPVSLLFTDIRLPGSMDGWELAEAARALHPALPVIYATGFTAEDPRQKEVYRCGDYNTAIIKTAKGRTIMLQHNVSTPRPYDRINLIQGTKGIFRDYPSRVFIEGQEGGRCLSSPG